MTHEPETVYGACNKCGYVGEMKRAGGVGGSLVHNRPGTDTECVYSGAELKGYGALKDEFEFRKDIDLTKPIYAQTEFTPDWKLSPQDQMRVKLTLALAKHIPGWPGCTDEQLDAVAAELMPVVNEATLLEREACAKQIEEVADDQSKLAKGNYSHEHHAAFMLRETAEYVRARGQA